MTPQNDSGLRDLVLSYSTSNVVALSTEDSFCTIAIDIPRFGFEFLT